MPPRTLTLLIGASLDPTTARWWSTLPQGTSWCWPREMFEATESRRKIGDRNELIDQP